MFSDVFRTYRFKKFASLEFDGEAYMSPMDFLDSMIQKRPRPRLKAKVLKILLTTAVRPTEVKFMHKSVCCFMSRC